jgi:hypothetical protein
MKTVDSQNQEKRFRQIDQKIGFDSTGAIELLLGNSNTTNF